MTTSTYMEILNLNSSYSLISFINPHSCPGTCDLVFTLHREICLVTFVNNSLSISHTYTYMYVYL